jgi:hypothetical protein
MSDLTPPPPGAPVPGMPVAPPAGAVPQNGMGTAALIMGILQFFCLGTIGSILAIVFGKIGMNKAARGEATNGGVAKAGFWLGIVGLVLTVIGVVIAIVLVVFGVKVASDAIDPARNSQTGLSDGTYLMEPNTSLRINDRCSFGGPVSNAGTGESTGSSVTVVGEGSIQCAGSGTPDQVLFTVTGGVASINALQ